MLSDAASMHAAVPQGAPSASLDLVPECDPMPGWKVTWNPPDCSGGSNGYPGGWGPEGRPPVAWAEVGDGNMEALAVPTVPPLALQPQPTTVRPANPAHLVLCGHAMLLGAMTATGNVITQKTRFEEFETCLRKESCAAAEAMTPVGGLILREHVFPTDNA